MQLRFRTDRPGRDGRKPGAQHREPRLSRRRLQSHDQRRRRLHRRAGPQGKNFVGCHSLEELVKSLATPRKVMMMVKAGPAVDALIEQLIPLLVARRRDHRRRQHATSPTPSAARKYVESKGLLYVGTRRLRRRRRGAERSQHDARRQRRRPGRWSSRSSRPSPPRSARRMTFPAANGSARAAPGTT